MTERRDDERRIDAGPGTVGVITDFTAIDHLAATDGQSLHRAALALANEVLRLRKQIEHRHHATVFERTAWHHDIGRHDGLALPFSFCPRCEMEHQQGAYAKLGEAAAQLAEALDDHRSGVEALVAFRALRGPHQPDLTPLGRNGGGT